jgi:hypothetical protein
VGFSRIFLQGILIFKELTAPRLYKSFGVKGFTFMPSIFSPVLFSERCINSGIGGRSKARGIVSLGRDFSLHFPTAIGTIQ